VIPIPSSARTYIQSIHSRWCTSCHAPRLTPDLPPPRSLAEDPGESRGVQMIDGGAPTQPEDAPGMKPASAAKTANVEALEPSMLTEAETLSSTGPTWSRRNPVILAASIPMTTNPSQRQRTTKSSPSPSTKHQRAQLSAPSHTSCHIARPSTHSLGCAGNVPNHRTRRRISATLCGQAWACSLGDCQADPPHPL
jgi:hypothetical protein